MSSNAVPPSVVPPSPDEWPQNLILPITGITRDSVATITSVGHGMTSSNNNTTFGTFKQVLGMIQINSITALVLKVIDADTFSVNVNTTNFHNYASAGVFILDTSLVPLEQQGFQYFNTPFQNIAN